MKYLLLQKRLNFDTWLNDFLCDHCFDWKIGLKVAFVLQVVPLFRVLWHFFHYQKFWIFNSVFNFDRTKLIKVSFFWEKIEFWNLKKSFWCDNCFYWKIGLKVELRYFCTGVYVQIINKPGYGMTNKVKSVYLFSLSTFSDDVILKRNRNFV